MCCCPKEKGRLIEVYAAKRHMKTPQSQPLFCRGTVHTTLIWHDHDNEASKCVCVTPPFLAAEHLTPLVPELVPEPAVQGVMHISVIGSHRIKHLRQLVFDSNFEVYNGKKSVLVLAVDREDNFVKAEDVHVVGPPPNRLVRVDPIFH